MKRSDVDRSLLAGDTHGIHNVAEDRHIDARRHRSADNHHHTDSGNLQRAESQHQGDDRAADRSEGTIDE